MGRCQGLQLAGLEDQVDGWTLFNRTLRSRNCQSVPRHATTLQDDEALLSNSGAALSPCVRAAVAARLERKRLLAAGDTLLRGYVDVIPL